MEMNDQKKMMANTLIRAYMQGREDAFKAVKDSLEVMMEELGPTKNKDYVEALKDCSYLVTKEEDLDKAKEH